MQGEETRSVTAEQHALVRAICQIRRGSVHILFSLDRDMQAGAEMLNPNPYCTSLQVDVLIKNLPHAVSRIMDGWVREDRQRLFAAKIARAQVA